VLLWSLAFFVGGQLAVSLALEHWGADREYRRKFAALRARRAGRPRAPLVLLLGSSCFGMGVRPELLPPLRAGSGRPAVVCNYGILRAGPLRELLHLRRLLRGGIRPDWVVIECCAPFMGEPFGTEEAAALPLGRYQWGDRSTLLRYGGDGQPRFRRRWWETHLVPVFSNRYDHLHALGALEWIPPPLDAAGRFIDIRPSGWTQDRRPTDPPEFLRQSASAVRAAISPCLTDWRLSAVSDQAMHELLALCARERIKAALLVMPEAGEIRQLYGPGSRADFDAYLARLGAAFGVRVIDAHRWAADADFSENIHLSAAGAAAFTARLGRDVLAPLLAGGAPTEGHARPIH
jgi:hypothetical protein